MTDPKRAEVERMMLEHWNHGLEYAVSVALKFAEGEVREAARKISVHFAEDHEVACLCGVPPFPPDAIRNEGEQAECVSDGWCPMCGSGDKGIRNAECNGAQMHAWHTKPPSEPPRLAGASGNMIVKQPERCGTCNDKGYRFTGYGARTEPCPDCRPQQRRGEEKP